MSEAHSIGFPWAGDSEIAFPCGRFGALCRAGEARRTAVNNAWIAERLAMGHPASMSQHVNRMRRRPRAAKQLKMHEQTLKSKD